MEKNRFVLQEESCRTREDLRKMKSEKLGMIIEKALYVIASVTFLPVLFCVVFIGNDMHYNEGLKLETLRTNRTLFLVALPVFLLTLFLIHVCSRHPLRKVSNRVMNLFLVLASVGVYFLSVRIAREIAFELPWDIRQVSSVATACVAERIPLNYNVYFSVYTNNIPITYILGELLYHARNTLDYPLNPQFIWLQVNCILMTAGIFFGALTAKRLTKNAVVTILAFLLDFFLVGLSAWKIAPYTDTYAQLFPILGIYCYVCYRQTEKKWKKAGLFTLTALSCVSGGGD